MRFLYLLLIMLIFSCSSEDSDSNSESGNNNNNNNQEQGCTSPTNLQAINVLGTSVSLIWEGNSAEVTFDIQYEETGFAIGDGIFRSSSASPFTLNELSLETTYDVYVRKNCGSFVSDWVGPVTFTTLCDDDGVFDEVEFLEFRSQGELDHFDWSCYEFIDCIVLIGPDYANVGDPITNLSSLGEVDRISRLQILQVSQLFSLEGLEDTEIDIFGVGGNSSLVNLEGLGNVTEGMGITSSSMETLAGMEHITSLKNLALSNLPNLATLEPLENFSSVGSLFLNQLPSLFSLNGLENLELAQSIEIIENESLTSISALSGLTEMSSFSDPNSGPFIYISKNTLLASLDGLQNINYPDDYNALYISVNNALLNLNGLPQLGNWQGSIRISNNENLTSLEGLSLTNISQRFELWSNPNLISISDLSGLTTVGDRFEIKRNFDLLSLDGLEDLNLVNGPLQIQTNLDLADFCAISDLVTNGTINGPYGVNGNAFNPTLEMIQNGECSE